jgi:hypothetical protein
MTDTQLLFAGPAFALLALLLFSIPSLRPKAFSLGIGWLGASMLFPMVIGYAFNSYILVSIAFFLKPIAAIVSVGLFVGYIITWTSKRPPLITFLPLVVLLCGSIADVFAVHKLSNGWGGASC